MAEQEIIEVGRWSVGLERQSGGTLLRFDFTDAPPLTFLVTAADAPQIAQAILGQYASPPPARSN